MLTNSQPKKKKKEGSADNINYRFASFAVPSHRAAPSLNETINSRAKKGVRERGKSKRPEMFAERELRRKLIS